MPQTVRFAKNGTVFTIDGTDILGKFRTAEIRIRQDLVDHSGPMDDWEYKTPRRVGATVSTTNFIRTTNDAMWSLVLPPSTTAVQIQCDLVDGGTFSGTFHVSELGESVSDDPNEESITFESTGQITITPAT